MDIVIVTILIHVARLRLFNERPPLSCAVDDPRMSREWQCDFCTIIYIEYVPTVTTRS